MNACLQAHAREEVLVHTPYLMLAASMVQQLSASRVSVVGICAMASPALPARPLESTAAWLIGTEDPSCSFSESLKRSPSRVMTPVLHTKQKKIILKAINVSWVVLEPRPWEGFASVHLSQGPLLPRRNKMTCLRKLRKSFPDPVTAISVSACRWSLHWEQLLANSCRITVLSPSEEEDFRAPNGQRIGLLV